MKTMPPFLRPAVSTVLNILGCVGMVIGVVMLATAQLESALLIFAASFSIFVWAQMLEHIARAAFFTERTAELLLAQQNRAESPTTPAVTPAPAGPAPIVYPAAPEPDAGDTLSNAARIRAEAEQARRAQLRSVYGQGRQ